MRHFHPPEKSVASAVQNGSGFSDMGGLSNEHRIKMKAVLSSGANHVLHTSCMRYFVIRISFSKHAKKCECLCVK